MMIAMSQSGGDEVEISDEQLEELREALGLNVPLPMQYWNWITGYIRGDWGTSLFRSRDVFEQFNEKWPLTLELGLLKDDEIKKLALISHYCIASYDLSVHALRELISRKSIEENALNSYLSYLASGRS